MADSPTCGTYLKQTSLPRNSRCFLPTVATMLMISLSNMMLALPAISLAKDAKSKPTSGRPQRGFRTFLPKPGETIDEPSSQVVQLLLDRQVKGEEESYMIQ